jgi:hypothetical protein
MREESAGKPRRLRPRLPRPSDRTYPLPEVWVTALNAFTWPFPYHEL